MRIGVIAYDYKLSCRACYFLANLDQDSTIHYSAIDFVVMKDGTIYQAISENTERLRGSRFNQIILVDDNRWEVLGKRKTEIALLINENFLSDVDWQIQKYDWT